MRFDPSKSESLLCTLNTHEAQSHLNIIFNEQTVPHNDHPKYLGVFLDRTLTYRHHLQNQGKKLSTRVNLINKLAGTQWGASADTLRTATLALVYSPAEYCASTWEESSHTRFVDVQLNNALRIISGTVKSTPLQWLPVLANIEPATIRRSLATNRLIHKCIGFGNSLLDDLLKQPPRHRLKGRRFIWDQATQPPISDGLTKWIQLWDDKKPNLNANLIQDPTIRVKGFDLNRSQWTTLNRLRTGHGCCNYLMNKWGLREDAACDCGDPSQTMFHITDCCPLRSFGGGIRELHEVTPAAIDWLSNLNLRI